MATPNEKLAESLARLQELQKTGKRIFQSSELTRVHRERLLSNGFLREVMKGWLISSSPDVADDDTTPWHASFWEFCVCYCRHRFGDQWYLSPEQSLLLHAENTVIPRQLIIYSPKGANNTLELLFGTSLYDLKQHQMPPEQDISILNGLRLHGPEAALVRVPSDFYTRNAVEAQVILSHVREASDILTRLLDGGRSAVAGRLAGAFRHIGRIDVADEILSTMKAAGYDVREVNPFESRHRVVTLGRSQAPIDLRLQTLWASMRSAVIDIFPKEPGSAKKDAYMRLVDEIYQHDAYHSLSIEGYRVTPELVEKVASEDWSPETREDDRRSLDALAARGYWQAFQLVKDCVSDIIDGKNPGRLAGTAHRAWYQQLFQPCVKAGLIPATTLAGYRNHPVFIRASRHVPPRWEAVRDAMPALFDLLEQEPEPCVRAVLGHWMFVYIHPYPDGNGRVARFVMNAMLASGGYPWTVIRVEDRSEYMTALESASVGLDIEPFARFIGGRCGRWSVVGDRWSVIGGR